jgi:hypothetical protein
VPVLDGTVEHSGVRQNRIRFQDRMPPVTRFSGENHAKAP